MTGEFILIEEDATVFFENYQDYNFGPAHALMSDWPYNLTSIFQRFGKTNSAPAQHGTDGVAQRMSKGFMQQEWDGVGIAYVPKLWQDISKALLPMAMTASFSHASTYHRLGLALDMAGFGMESSLMGWFYGGGPPWGTTHPDFEGYEYGNPLKPAIEPILMAYNQYDPVNLLSGKQNSKANVAKMFGTGMYNIGETKKWLASDRFPATFFATHHPDCLYIGEKEIKNTSGSVSEDLSQSKLLHTHNPTLMQTGWDAPDTEMTRNYICHPDCPVSHIDNPHYFLEVDWTYEAIEQMPIFYSGKVSPRERDAFMHELSNSVRQRANSGGLSNTDAWKDTLKKNPHPTLKPIRLTTWLAKLMLPPEQFAPRTIIIPCSGVGSESIGCLLGGWDRVISVQIPPTKPEEHNYPELQRHRVAGWQNLIKYGQTDLDHILKEAARLEEEYNQLQKLAKQGEVIQQKELFQ